MAKRGLYFEDLQKSVFVVHVHDGLKTYLEQREWTLREGLVGDDAFHVYNATLDGCTDRQEQLYQWIDRHSRVIATSPVTERWTEREWLPVIWMTSSPG